MRKKIPKTMGSLWLMVICEQGSAHNTHKDGVGVIAIHGLSREQWNKLCCSVNQDKHE